jgi:hypothetical protein
MGLGCRKHLITTRLYAEGKMPADWFASWLFLAQPLMFFAIPAFMAISVAYRKRISLGGCVGTGAACFAGCATGVVESLAWLASIRQVPFLRAQSAERNGVAKVAARSATSARWLARGCQRSVDELPARLCAHAVVSPPMTKSGLCLWLGSRAPGGARGPIWCRA